MSLYDTSYPPSLYGLPGSHDLKLVGTPTPGTLTVSFTWDSDGKRATLDFGDGTAPVSSATEAATHTYPSHAIYHPRVSSGSASDSATLDLTVTDDPEADDEPTDDDEPADDEPQPEYTAVPVDEIPTD
jgi:hypothetical protein